MQNVVIEQEGMKMFGRLLYGELAAKKDIRKVIRKEMNVARRGVMQAARSAMGSDPRKAANAVKLIVYKDARGAMLNLMNGKKAKNVVEEGSHSDGGVSGIRRKRKVSARTKKVNGYRGKDRSFILRFVNQGTVARYAGTRGNTMRKAFRGSIMGKKFFQGSANSQMEAAAGRLQKQFGRMIQEASVGK